MGKPTDITGYKIIQIPMGYVHPDLKEGSFNNQRKKRKGKKENGQTRKIDTRI